MGQAHELMLMGQAHEHILMGQAHEHMLMAQAREEFPAWIHRIRSPKTQINENRLELGPRSTSRAETSSI